MSSLWPSALASLDDSLVLPYEGVGQLKAAKSVDIEELIEQLKLAAESAQNLRALVSSELPEASWQNREELDALIVEIEKRVEARKIEQLRSRLLALAAELEGGSIVHRRALRANEVNQLRDQAIDELRSQAGLEGSPPALPGPEADQWIDWACGLQEPDDAESLQTLRSGFPHLDDFIANLEPDMWVVKTALQAAAPNAQELEEKQKALEQLRSRLLALAAELERGSIVHHRAVRVNELNQLRDQAIDELRSQAGLEGAPPTLPGPEADQWIEWACSLQEPEDAESLQTLRSGFPHLDDFIASLEPNMWRAAGSPALEILPEAERSADTAPQRPSALETSEFEEFVVSSGPIPIRLKAAKSIGGRDEPRFRSSVEEPSVSTLEADTVAPSYVTPLRTEEEVLRMRARERELLARMRSAAADQASPFKRGTEAPITAWAFRVLSAAKPIVSNSRTKAEELLKGKWRIPVVAAALVLLLAALGAVLWRSHRAHAGSSPVKAAEKADFTPSNPENQGSNQPGVSTDSATQTSGLKLQTEKPPKPKDQNVAAKPLPEAPPPPEVSKLDDRLRLPVAIPKNSVRKEDASPGEAAETPGAVPGALPGGVPNSVISVVKNIPVAEPRMAVQKVTVSSGVAQALLIHQVPPQYPLNAREAGIQGTVVLQAVIGKDGTVHNVHALRGPPVLVQAALDAVKQWRYKPYSLNGQPVEANTEINVKFTAGR